MVKSLLVVLDATPASEAAQRVAFRIAKRHAARLAGVAGVDVPSLTAPEAVPLGAVYYKEHADAERLRQARAHVEKAVARFRAACKGKALTAEVVVFEDDPYRRLVEASGSHDLLVLGRDTAFDAGPADGPGGTVERLLHDNPRPLILVPPEERAGDAIVIAFDGSVPAMRALQVFALLGFATTGPLHVISIAETDAEASEIGGRAREYLNLYGVKAKVHGIGSKAQPAGILSAEAKGLDAGLMMMGAFGRRGWRELLLGSSTERLLAECPTALFIHH